ncbi:MAG: transposase [Candidatus Buchananbacteria bacterium RBG_13_39_9]|uniref:Transposase n=1 Tax=Candidatus Buchananbacteria bacterium RBG_13_39_9 TaxID=1797531 RepID=A0A1G1XRK6_9BACT|nr:MAG: transposase [Candidatus Buchananbacteria bacterium RBG_13_39_9]
MKNKYHRLTLEEREEISNGLWAGETFTVIAERLDRDVSTITREVRNNCKYKLCYRAVRTHQVVMARRKRQKQPKKLEVNQNLNGYILEKLNLKWSPEEIAKRLKVDYPDNMTMRISHESIYTYIYCLPKGELKKELIKCLRRERNLRRKRKNGHERRGGIVDAISISERPAEVAERTIPGHWEGDLMMGKNRTSAIGTLVERTTRYTLLVPLEAKDACSVRIAFARATKKIPRYLKKTITYDRGKEMAEHKLFTKDTKIQVYFADPYSPWQRGTNENTNGLIRQFFPKGTDFKSVTKKEIRHVQDLLNDRPRKTLDFYKPDEVFSKLLIH